MDCFSWTLLLLPFLSNSILYFFTFRRHVYAPRSKWRKNRQEAVVAEKSFGSVLMTMYCGISLADLGATCTCLLSTFVSGIQVIHTNILVIYWLTSYKQWVIARSVKYWYTPRFGDKRALEPEPWNLKDKNAVSYHKGDHVVGHFVLDTRISYLQRLVHSMLWWQTCSWTRTPNPKDKNVIYQSIKIITLLDILSWIRGFLINFTKTGSFHALVTNLLSNQNPEI